MDSVNRLTTKSTKGPSVTAGASLGVGQVSWEPRGSVSLDHNGDLLFPPSPNSRGIYRFLAFDGGGAALFGYVGQTGRQTGLAGRFKSYRNRGRDRRRGIVRDWDGTTIEVASRLVTAIRSGSRVTVETLRPTLVRGAQDTRLNLDDDLVRRDLETQLILDLRKTGLMVLNRT